MWGSYVLLPRLGCGIPWPGMNQFILIRPGDLFGMLAGGLERKRWLLQHEEPREAEAGRLF